jgi:hypothetical protein
MAEGKNAKAFGGACEAAFLGYREESGQGAEIVSFHL